MLDKLLARYIVRHRRNHFIRHILIYNCKQIIRYYENASSKISWCDQNQNGERYVLEKAKKHFSAPTVLDVGANVGEWTLMAHETFNSSVIHSFEIAEPTYKELLENVKGYASVKINNVGLSNKNEKLKVYYVKGGNTGQTTCLIGLSKRYQAKKRVELDAAVITGDTYIKDNRIGQVDFLKIDTEGYEFFIVEGFKTLLEKGGLKMIQFEYGSGNIETRKLLIDFYEFLAPFGMKIGKMYPNYVDFKDYGYSDENFSGSNFLAVHESLDGLIRDLS